jgi:hypothetical protein
MTRWPFDILIFSMLKYVPILDTIQSEGGKLLTEKLAQGMKLDFLRRVVSKSTPDSSDRKFAQNQPG